MAWLDQQDGRLSVQAATLGDFAIGCAGCGTVQDLPRPAPAGVVLACPVCRTPLERTVGRSLDAALACAGATLILLIPANLCPLLTTAAVGTSRTSHLISSATAMWRDGQPWVGIVVCLFLVIAPLLRFALLTAVLIDVREGRIRSWTGRAFRWDQELQLWAMADVFLLALLVTYARLHATISVRLEAGAYCFVAAGVMTLVTRAVLDRRAVWEAIAPAGPPPTGVSISCPGCDLLLPASFEGRACPRCADTVHSRLPGAVRRATALTLAGLFLYAPANLYPIAILPMGLRPMHYTVLEGVKDLFQSRLYGLGLLVFCASFLIPMFKLFGLSWCILSVNLKWRRFLVAKTRTYRVVEEIGRWSMIDPFVIGTFVPVMQYNDFVYARPEPAAVAFTGVVVLTMLAARCFDPRLMWDAAETRA
jgi:paraquat-inducible protein A